MPASSDAAVTWIHLSDFHAGHDAGDVWRWVDTELQQDLRQLAGHLGTPDLVLFTGDLTNRGRKEEFEHVDRLLDRIDTWFGRPLPVIAVPGNHDHLDLAPGVRRPDRSREDPRNTDAPTEPVPVSPHYAAWAERRMLRSLRESGLEHHFCPHAPGDVGVVLDKGGHRVGVIGLDLVPTLDRPPTTRPEPFGGTSQEWLERVDAAILLTHHPLGRLDRPADTRPLERLLGPARIILSLCGHMHRASARSGRTRSFGPPVTFQARSLFGRERCGARQAARPMGYAWGRILPWGEIRVWPRARVPRGAKAHAFVHDECFELAPDELGGTVLLRPMLRAMASPPRMRSAPPECGPPPSTTASRRFQLRFWADGVERQRSLPPSSTVEIEALIGSNIVGHAAPGPIDEGALHYEDEGAVIDVVLAVLEGGEASTSSQRLLLPRRGASDPVSFSVETLDAGTLRAIISFNHRGRQLQSVELTAALDDEDQGELRLQWSSVSRAPGTLSSRQGMDASLDHRGDKLIATQKPIEPTKESTDAEPISIEALAIETEGLDQLMEKLDGVLAGLPGSSSVPQPGLHGAPPTLVFDPVDSEPSKEGSSASTVNPLRSKATERALRDLATQGYFLYRKILARGANIVELRESFKNIHRLQIVSAVQGDVLPIECCYDRNQPRPDAQICPGAERALETGSCTTGCGLDGRHICPLGFWGLRMVIERQVRTVSGEGDFVLSTTSDEALRRIHPLGATLFAASSLVDAVVANGRQSVADACQQFAARYQQTAQRVETWDDWEVQVDRLQPRLMVLLPHVEQPKPGDCGPTPPLVLEIGQQQRLELDHLRKTHVLHVPAGADEVTHEGYGNVVLLLGCETSRQRTYEQIIERFQMHGAKVIFATLNRIRGRHAAPLAVELLRWFGARPHQSVGESLLAFRRAMLLEGYPAVMGIVGFGDADWTVG